MLFMVIERFKNRDAKAVYSRFKEKGRMMPDGLKYVGSWVEDNFDRCFQLMECDDPVTIHKFCSMLPAFVFEVHPVITVEEAVRGELEVIAWRDGLKHK